MKRTQFSVLFLIAAVLPGIHSASGQAINATMQNASPRGITTRSAPAVAARPIASAPVAPHIVARPTGFSPQRFSPYVPRTIAQPPANLPNYSPLVRHLNPTVASVMAQRGGSGQQAIIVDPATRQTELRTLAAMRERRTLGVGQPIALDPETHETELRTLPAMHEHREIGTQNRTLATTDPQQRVATDDPAAAPQPQMRE